MKPQDIDLPVYFNTDFERTIVLTDGNGQPYKLTGATVTGPISTRIGDPIITTFDIAVSEDSGTILIKLPAAKTRLLPAKRKFHNQPNLYVFNIDITEASGKIIRILQGYVSVYPALVEI